jgi:transcriptional regulator with XRE-family HTH domain
VHAAEMEEAQIYQEVGGAVAARRKALGLTQAQIANKIGLSRASLANIERGNQKVLLHHIYALADALEMQDVRELLPLGIRSKSAPEAEPFIPSGASLNETQLSQVQRLVEAATVAGGKN